MCVHTPQAKHRARLVFFTTDTTVRRRLLWVLRVLLILCVLGWTVLVGELPHSFSPLSFTGGLLVLLLLVHVLDYYDVVSYSDVHHDHTH